LRLELYKQWLPEGPEVREVSLSSLRHWAQRSGLGTKALHGDLRDLVRVGFVTRVKKAFPGLDNTLRRRTVVRFLPLQAVTYLALPRWNRLTKQMEAQNDRLSRDDVSKALDEIGEFLKELIVTLSDPAVLVKEGDALIGAPLRFLPYWVGQIFNSHRNYRDQSS
jgi:hypothetical protein